MLTVANVELHIEREFGSRLETLGFQRLGKRRWVRSQKLPIRELFVIGTLRGARYSPVWGFSSGFSPSFRGQTFRHQSTERNVIMDLIIDPIDITGDVPRQTFSFITGHSTEIPIEQIRTCAEHFVPQALADFDRVRSVYDFCKFFVERSRLKYRRLGFDMYVQHKLAHGFVLLLNGKNNEGLNCIREFCRTIGVEFDDRVLSECIRNAQAQPGA